MSDCKFEYISNFIEEKRSTSLRSNKELELKMATELMNDA